MSAGYMLSLEFPGWLQVGEKVSEALTLGQASCWMIQTFLPGLLSVCIVGLSKEDTHFFFLPAKSVYPQSSPEKEFSKVCQGVGGLRTPPPTFSSVTGVCLICVY